MPSTSETEEAVPNLLEIKLNLILLLFAVLVKTASPDPLQNAVLLFSLFKFHNWSCGLFKRKCLFKCG